MYTTGQIKLNEVHLPRTLTHSFWLDTVFPGLDALHILDASAHCDAGSSGINMFQTPLKFNVQIDASAPSDAGHATHNVLIDAQASNRGNTACKLLGQDADNTSCMPELRYLQIQLMYKIQIQQILPIIFWSRQYWNSKWSANETWPTFVPCSLQNSTNNYVFCTCIHWAKKPLSTSKPPCYPPLKCPISRS